ncbi:hypothetical protein CDV55_105150 [Aspergillus turcosus]|uniref:Heterokaryon incompatibility domain-containing protein n=1 Tax=Aspergillus turcosus TaxID=1245748 RepID=A0A397I4T8_9EURO|nr:hypothetical protein CDV55_105150 [Aspergillus turcosus]RLL97670.1 hypothetical protein CFD26_106231 [Aspergillus turcosus]
MADLPVQSAWALSRAQVSAILDRDIYHPTETGSGSLPIEVRFMQFGEIGEAGNYELISMAKTKARIGQWCRDAFALLDPQSRDLGSHLVWLDAMFSTLVTCSFHIHRRKLAKDDIVGKACALLARLPSHPPELPFQYESKNGQSDLNSPWPVEYFCPLSTVAGQTEGPRDRYTWTKLRVFSRPSTNVVRIALFLVMEPSAAFSLTSDYSDTIVSLLNTVTDLCRSAITKADAQSWFILQAFLWAAWQQTVMLQMWYDATRQLNVGYSFERHNHLISREIPSVMPGREIVEWSRPTYMCKWAFELLRSDLSSVTWDFRRLFEIYELHFGDHAPRCNPAAGCVCLEETDDQYIRYRPVTAETMAVSHVWSHGQGGRPETGFNRCLHRRYTALARSFGCTSYWMDTPCIPTDDELRDEAIAQINSNFVNSKVTLLVDRDLMEIDIHPLTLQAEEAILAALVVCDWNVSAWTLLEGMRGRLKLHILCKDNRVIALVDVLSDVLAKSSLGLVSPCLAIQHYTPTDKQRYQFLDQEPVTIEQATCLLNHRHATKDRDVTMIWSLVCGSNKVVKTAVDFWRSTVGQPLATGFLVSSAPRIKARGLSWAPSRPNLLPPTASTPDGKQYPAFDGENSVAGRIVSEGFRAEWLICPIRRSRALPVWFSLYTYADANSHFDAYYKIYNGGANSKMDLRSLLKLRSVIAPLLKQYRWVGLLQPALRHRLGTGAASPPQPFLYQGEAKGPLLVVVASNEGDEWEWQFIHEWDLTFQLPEFSLEELLNDITTNATLIKASVLASVIKWYSD